MAIRFTEILQKLYAFYGKVDNSRRKTPYKHSIPERVQGKDFEKHAWQLLKEIIAPLLLQPSEVTEMLTTLTGLTINEAHQLLNAAYYIQNDFPCSGLNISFHVNGSEEITNIEYYFGPTDQDFLLLTLRIAAEVDMICGLVVEFLNTNVKTGKDVHKKIFLYADDVRGQAGKLPSKAAPALENIKLALAWLVLDQQKIDSIKTTFSRENESLYLHIRIDDLFKLQNPAWIFDLVHRDIFPSNRALYVSRVR